MEDQAVRCFVDNLPLGCRENFCSGDTKTVSSGDEDAGVGRRARRITPSERKDEFYWARRVKNNESAKKSRDKRRDNSRMLERQILSLLEENASLRAELLALRFRFGEVRMTPGGPLFEDSSVTSGGTPNTQRPAVSWSSEASGLLGSSVICSEAPPCAREQEGFPGTPNETLKSLPLKLRFKGGYISSCCDVRLRGANIVRKHAPEDRAAFCEPPHLKYQQVSLQTQINSLSQEVAQLKRIWSLSS